MSTPILKVLKKVAFRSTHRRYKTGSIIVSKKGEILSKGCSHTGVKLYDLLSIHSERHALTNARHIDLSGCVIYTVTFSGKSGNITTGKPCISCAGAVRSAGIERIYYSLPGGDWGWFNTDTLEDELLKDYSIENYYGKVSWEPPGWAIPNRRKK